MLNESIGYSRDIEFDFPSLIIDTDLEVHDFKGSIRLTRTGQGIFTQGDLSAKTSFECVRCLSAFDQDLHAQLDELFVYPPDKSGDEILCVHEDGNLDLSPLVREVLLLDVPIQPLCQSDCRGFCPLCGANANETVCHHPDTHIDPRLEVLKTLKIKS